MRFCCRARVVDRVQRDLTFLAATVFAAADQLWTNSALRPDRYAQPVLALIGLRQMEAKFVAVHAELAPNYKGRLKPTPSDYQAAYHLRRPSSVSLTTPSTLLLEGDLACWVATFALLQKQRRSREVWYRHVHSQLKASSDRAI